MNNQLLSLEPRYRVILPEVTTTTIIQVGVGGTGSWLAMSLARLVYHAGQSGQSVNLVLVDPDVVENRNVGRQGFSVAEIGQNKAESMALRLSLALGIEVAAAAAPFVAADFVSWASQQYRPYGSEKTRLVLVGAVDNYLARCEMAKAAISNHATWTSSGRARSTGSGRVWAVDCGNGRHVVDICAGTGRLAYAVLAANGWQPQAVQVTAVEFNPEFVRVGRRLLPEVEWILGDCYDLSLWQSLPRFDEAISNPPCGAVVTEHDTDWVGYHGPAGLTVAAIGLQVARLGIKMILPQVQTIFRYSGSDLRYGAHADSYPGYLKKFMTQRPDLEWDHRNMVAR